MSSLFQVCIYVQRPDSKTPRVNLIVYKVLPVEQCRRVQVELFVQWIEVDAVTAHCEAATCLSQQRLRLLVADGASLMCGQIMACFASVVLLHWVCCVQFGARSSTIIVGPRGGFCG